MLCVQCGTDNPDGTKFCVSCNAVLPMQPLASSSSMDIAENVEYLVPEAHYQSPVLQQLAWTVHDFIEEEAELEPVIEAYEAREWAEAVDISRQHLKRFPDDLVASIYLDRCSQFSAIPPVSDWDGVFSLKSK